MPMPWYIIVVAISRRWQILTLSLPTASNLEIPATEGQVEGTTPAPAEQNANQQPLPSQPQNAEEPKE